MKKVMQMEQATSLYLASINDRINQIRQIGKVTPLTVTLLASLCFETDDGNIITPATHHRVWLKLMCNTDIKKLLILAPPESAKTTWMAAFLGVYLGFHPEQNTVIASSSGLVAIRRSQALRNLISSPMWTAIFPNITKAEGMEWSASAFSLAPGGKPFPGRLHPSVSSYGTGGSVIGARADIIVADDLLDFNNSRTPASRELVKNWTHSSLLTRRKSGDNPGRTIVIGTAWNAADLYASLTAEGDWVTCRMPLIKTDREDGYYAYLEYPDSWQGSTLGEEVMDDFLR